MSLTNGLIAFTSDRSGNRDIWVMNPDGSNPRDLTNNPAADRGPSWSPDGTKIAFSSDRFGEEDIFVMNVDGSNQTRLTTAPGPDFEPSWSPDGTKIVFASLRDGHSQIYAMNADGSNQTRLTNDAGNDLEPSWSPDGTKILFASDRTGSFEIFRMNADGSNQAQLTNDPSANLEAFYSPDGSQIVFTSNRTGNADVWLMNADGSNLRQLTTNPANDFIAQWSPDGTKLVFGSFRNEGHENIFVMNPDGSDQTPLTSVASTPTGSPVADFLPTWQPVGRSATPPVPPPPPSPPQTAIPIADLPLLLVDPAAAEAGDDLVFNVRLVDPNNPTQPKSINHVVTTGIATLDGTSIPPQLSVPFGLATQGQDYVEQSILLIFQPGEVFKQVHVKTIPKADAEPNKVMVFVVFNPSGAAVPADINQRGNVGKIINQVPPAQTAGTDVAQEFSQGFTGHPAGMFLGPDGNFWFTEQFDQKIGMFDPRTLKATEFNVPNFTNPNTGISGIFPHNGTVGPDGNLWFVGMNDVVLKFDPRTHAFTIYNQVITAHGTPHVITTAPDGMLYFSEQDGGIQTPDPRFVPSPGNGRLGQIDPTTGKITEFSAGLPRGNLMHGVTVGPDGNVWVALQGTSQIARFNLATKTFDRFAQFPPGSGPIDLVTGPDGNIYTSLQLSNQLGKVDPNTLQTTVIPTSLSRLDGPSVDQITVGPDGRSIWFVEFQNDRIARFDIPTQTITEYYKGISPNSAPLGMSVGPDGNMWFSEVNLYTTPGSAGRFGRLVPTPIPPPADLQGFFVTSVFRDLLGHAPDPATAARLTSLLKGGAPRSQVVRTIISSSDYRAQAVANLYLTYLQRSPSQDEVNRGVALLQKGVRIEKLQAAILASPEYIQSRGGGTMSGFATALLGDVFGYPVPARIQQRFRRLLNRAASPFTVANQVLNTTEARQALIDSFDRRFLLRPANSTGANDFADRGRSADQIAATILSSREYYAFRALAVPRKFSGPPIGEA